MLRDDQVLVLEGLGVLSRQAINKLLNCVFHLQGEVSEYEFIVYYELLNRFLCHLYFKWKIVFNWRHLGELQELLELLAIIIVIKSANQQVAWHLIRNLPDLPKLVDIKYLVLFQIGGDQNSQFELVDDTELCFEFYEVVAVIPVLLVVSLVVIPILFTSSAASGPRHHALEVILEYLRPEIGVQILPKKIDLFITGKHPVINIKHVSLNYHLDVFLALIQCGRTLQLLGLRLIKQVQLLPFVLVIKSNLLVAVCNQSLH